MPEASVPIDPVGAGRPGLDPRTKILLLLTVSVVVMSPSGTRFVPAALLIGIGLALAERAWLRALALPLAAVMLWVLGWMLPLWWPNPVTAIIALACIYLIRFVVTIGVGLHLLATTSPTQLSAGLRSWRVPRPIAVTLAVMLRFFPVVATEASAVLDGMRLRGLVGGTAVLRHPILSLERFTVPMIAASLRASEDLSASAVLRGLGSMHRPTAMVPPRFALPDLLLLLVVAALAAATLASPEVLR